MNHYFYDSIYLAARAEVQKYFHSFFGSNENFKICFRDILTFNLSQFFAIIKFLCQLQNLPVNDVVVDVDSAIGSSLHPPSFRGRRLRGWYLYSGWSRLCLSLSLSASLWNGVFSSSFKILEKKGIKIVDDKFEQFKSHLLIQSEF